MGSKFCCSCSYMTDGHAILSFRYEYGDFYMESNSFFVFIIPLVNNTITNLPSASVSCSQGWDRSRCRFGRTWIEMNFWPCIWFGEPIFGYLYFKRYFLPILKMHFGVLLDTEPVSGSGSLIHNLWFGPSLACSKSTKPLARPDPAPCPIGRSPSPGRPVR